MPTYEYECLKCRKDFELVQSMKDNALTTCPKDQCRQKKWGKGKVKRKLGAGAGIIFKGSGFYITDYRSEGYKKDKSSSSKSSESTTKADTAKSESPKPASNQRRKPIDDVNRGLVISVLLTWLGFGFAPMQAQEDANAPQLPTTSTSQAYPALTCTCTDPAGALATFQLAADIREQLGPLLKLGPTWRFPVHIHIVTPEDPDFARIDREASAAFASEDNKSMRIEAAMPSTDPDTREFLQRQFVRSLLWEKFFATTTTFDTKTKLDVVPVWLIEGLRESLDDDPEHNRESIVRKTVQEQRAPLLESVTRWQEISDDRLLGTWQKAFCFYLVDSLTQPGPRRDDFQKWLSTVAGPNPTSAQFLFPTEMAWQRELVDATERSRNMVYTWGESAAELASMETIAIPESKASKTKICTLETVANFPRDKNLTTVLQEKVLVLTALELRAHASWHPILELYRAGLSSLISDPNPEKARKLLREANQARIAEMDNHQKLVDYLNWFEVTKDLAGNTTHFGGYFSTAHQMEKVEADPTHPNPIRDNLLQVESKL